MINKVPPTPENRLPATAPLSIEIHDDSHLTYVPRSSQESPNHEPSSPSSQLNGDPRVSAPPRRLSPLPLPYLTIPTPSPSPLPVTPSGSGSSSATSSVPQINKVNLIIRFFFARRVHATIPHLSFLMSGISPKNF